MTGLENYSKSHLNLWQITKCNLRHNFVPHLGLAAIILLIAPLLFGTENLDILTSAAPLEMFVSLIGIVLLTPVFMPEQRPEIEEVTCSKTIRDILVYGLRLIYSIAALLFLVCIFCLVMYIQHCEITMTLVFGCFTSALFLGACGVFASSLCNNSAVAYMVPVLVYGMNFAGKKALGNFYLFSMAQGEYYQKLWLFVTAMILLAASLVIKYMKRRLA